MRDSSCAGCTGSYYHDWTVIPVAICVCLGGFLDNFSCLVVCWLLFFNMLGVRWLASLW